MSAIQSTPTSISVSWWHYFSALREETLSPKPKPWRLTRHLPGFRPLCDGESWHRQDFAEDDLPKGFRPLLLNEKSEPEDQSKAFNWKPGPLGDSEGRAQPMTMHARTRRPLPEPAKVVAWDGPQDFPVNCWLRHKQIPQVHYRPFSAEPLGVAIFYTQGKILSWQVLADWYEHSFNCKTWLPCTKEVAP